MAGPHLKTALWELWGPDGVAVAAYGDDAERGGLAPPAFPEAAQPEHGDVGCRLNVGALPSGPCPSLGSRSQWLAEQLWTPSVCAWNYDGEWVFQPWGSALALSTRTRCNKERMLQFCVKFILVLCCCTSHTPMPRGCPPPIASNRRVQHPGTGNAVQP